MLLESQANQILLLLLVVELVTTTSRGLGLYPVLLEQCFNKTTNVVILCFKKLLTTACLLGPLRSQAFQNMTLSMIIIKNES